MQQIPIYDLQSRLGFRLGGPRRQWEALHRRFPALRYVWKSAGALSLTVFFAGILLFMSLITGQFGKLPTEQDLRQVSNYLATEVYAADSTLLGRYYFENRSRTRYRQISPHFIQALLATEDARFFEHSGVDLRSWGRVFFKTVLLNDRSSGGGSTLTQQLAKNLYPREEFPYASLVINKLKEVLIAKRIEHLYSKEEILELYLNTVPFSENTYGIKVAAHRFFNTTPADLTVAQSAVLVGMLKATSLYNPVAHPQRAMERRNLVLDQMCRYEYLQPSEAERLKEEPLCLDYAPIDNNRGLATHFREHLRLELKELLKPLRKPNGMAYNLYTDGLKVYTTLDAGMQRYAEEAVREHLALLQGEFDRHLRGETPWENEQTVQLAIYLSERHRIYEQQGLCEETIDSLFRLPVEMTVFDWKKGERNCRMSPLDSIRYYLSLLNAGFLAASPADGAIKAWVGGIDHRYFQYDHVRSKRQVGSTFKPIVYARAIQRGIHPCSYTANQLRTYARYDHWQPRNADEKYGGSYSMEGGLINSINTVTINLALRSGPATVAQLAEDLGIDGPVPGVPAIALGAVEASLLDMVQVYGSFANRGLRPELRYLDRIETHDGKVLVDFARQADTCHWMRPLSVQEADLINEMLQAAIDRGTGRRLRYRYGFKNELAGKTGTSQNHSDGWFMGYTPKLVSGVWVGAESPDVHFRNLTLGQGANTALPVFANFLRKLNGNPELRHWVDTPFPQPSVEVRSLLNCPNAVWPEVPVAEPAGIETDVAASPAGGPTANSVAAVEAKQ